MIATLGSIGMGLVWGWLLVLIIVRDQRPVPGILLLGLATLLAALELFFFSGWQSLVFFLAAAVFSLLAHRSWRRSLRQATSLAGE